MDIPRNIPLYLVLMMWNYYKCKMDIAQVRKHQKDVAKLQSSQVS